MGCAEEIEEMLEIKVYEIGGQQEIFISEVWRRLFDINEIIYTELYHEFYSTYDFDEVCADDELRTKKVIKFRLGGGLRSDENFNARDYWLSIISEEELHLSQSLASTIRRPILRFIIRIAKRMGLLTDEVLNSLSAPIYCRAVNAITLREVIGPDGRLIAEDLAPGETLERMARRQLYHTDRYAGLFEYMAGHYNILVQGVYAPPGYDEEQQDDEE
ncbi:hypothetical protein Tco_0907554 [Tanacetum coccineum]|uniref:Uncharacterized protein n=1 Tax=Tanacetum coccineum TaxID=301880 RepID=A0ABQ5CR22_9ASTR